MSALVVFGAGCSGGSKDATPTTTEAFTEVATTTLPPCAPAMEAALLPPVEGHDPYVIAGARQPPGPAMTTTTLPSTPVSIIVQVPPRPFDPAVDEPPESSSGESALAASGGHLQAPAPEPQGCSEPIGPNDP